MSSEHQTTVRKLAAFIYLFSKYCNYFLCSPLITVNCAHVCIEELICSLDLTLCKTICTACELNCLETLLYCFITIGLKL